MRGPIKTSLLMAAGSSLLVYSAALAHEAHHQAPAGERALLPQTPIPFEKINNSYLRQIQPIFRKKCFDCHSDQTRFPWYYKLPIAKQLIDRDVREGRKHLDLSNDFPFGGHHPPDEQLVAIREVIEKDTMPLKRYRLLHRDSTLLPEEVRIILEWVEISKKHLTEN